MASVWKIAPGESAEDWEESQQYGCVGLGWMELADYGIFRSREEVLAALIAAYPHNPNGNRGGAATSIWHYVHEVQAGNEVQAGDIVVANQGLSRVVGIGVITSEYLSPHSPRNPIPIPQTDYDMWRRHARRVDWRIVEPIDLPRHFFARSTVTRLRLGQVREVRQTYLRVHPQLTQVIARLFAAVPDIEEAETGLPEEVPESPTYSEGSVQRILVNRYERDPQARRACIDYYGHTCFICDLDFGQVYGEVVEGLIHVHHLRPLSEIGGEYIIDPIWDLRPVCPNCHAVLHSRTPPYSIEDVQGFLE